MRRDIGQGGLHRENWSMKCSSNEVAAQVDKYMMSAHKKDQ